MQAVVVTEIANSRAKAIRRRIRTLPHGRVSSLVEARPWWVPDQQPTTGFTVQTASQLKCGVQPNGSTYRETRSQSVRPKFTDDRRPELQLPRWNARGNSLRGESNAVRIAVGPYVLRSGGRPWHLDRFECSFRLLEPFRSTMLNCTRTFCAPPVPAAKTSTRSKRRCNCGSTSASRPICRMPCGTASSGFPGGG